MYNARQNIGIVTAVLLVMVIPFIQKLSSFFNQIISTDLSNITINPEVYLVAFIIIGIVGMLTIRRYIRKLDAQSDDRGFMNFYCPECGSQYKVGEEFCYNCGSNVTKQKNREIYCKY